MSMANKLLLLIGLSSVIINLPYISGTRVEICKGDEKVIKCGRQQYIHVNKAQYGRLSDACSYSLWTCSGANVLNTVRNQCGLRSRTCKLRASNQLYGKHCNWGEFLRVDYECKGAAPPSGMKIRQVCDRYSLYFSCLNGKVINIRSAFYGRISSSYCPTGDTSNTNCYIDATRKTRQYAQGKRHTIVIANSARFGDPCPGISKYLEIRYECVDPGSSATTSRPIQPKTTMQPPPTTIKNLFNIRRLCDRYSGYYSCQNGLVINIISAFYGRRSSSYCPTGDTSNTNCYTDATAHIRFGAQGKTFAVATASSAYFGDPCPGISKYLEIRYECRDPASLATTSRPIQPTTTTQPPPTTTKKPVSTRRLCDRYSGYYSCVNGLVINIISAFYGRRSSSYCPTGDTSNTNCYTDATAHIRFGAQGKTFAVATASSAYFGDPCPGISKYLEIRYECVDPAQITPSPRITTQTPSTREVTTPIMPPIPPGSCGVSQVARSRIIGGKIAITGAWPWQIALYRNGEFQCGGSLIHPEWIVTATHCVEKIETGDVISDYYVVLGENDRSTVEQSEEKRQLQKIILHPEYNQVHKYNNDIAMLKLDRPVLLTMFISPVCLPQQGEKVKVGTRCVTSGWGMTTYPSNPSNLLQQATLPVVSKQKCIRRLETSLGNQGLSISNQMLCAGYGDNSTASDIDITTCRGDSGGPFVCQEADGKWTLQGVTSWGSIRCLGRDRYSVFTRVSQFRDWIDGVIKNDGLPPAPPQPPILG